jgi:hypothetical protein
MIRPVHVEHQQIASDSLVELMIGVKLRFVPDFVWANR